MHTACPLAMRPAMAAGWDVPHRPDRRAGCGTAAGKGTGAGPTGRTCWWGLAIASCPPPLARPRQAQPRFEPPRCCAQGAQPHSRHGCHTLFHHSAQPMLARLDGWPRWVPSPPGLQGGGVLQRNLVTREASSPITWAALLSVQLGQLCPCLHSNTWPHVCTRSAALGLNTATALC